MTQQTAPAISERGVIFFIASVQFISVLEFMIVMPLGPDFAEHLGIASSNLGWIGGAYTAAAAISGLLSSFFIERYDRRSALSVTMAGLILATAAAGLASNLETLLIARVLAGCFGGPATSLSLAIIADVVPIERRGRAMGSVMMSFALASVVGVPAGLELANLGGWRLPFLVIAGLGVVTVFFAWFNLPSLKGHLEHHAQQSAEGFAKLLRKPTVLLAFAITFFLMTGMFLIVPNISAFVQDNMHYPRSQMGVLYLCGGLASFFLMRIVGKLVDRYDAVKIATLGTGIFIVVALTWFIFEAPTWTVLPLFVALMSSSSFRMVPYQTLSSNVPEPYERARFMSLQSCIQHISTTCGAFLSSMLLSDGPNGSLAGMDTVGMLAITLTLLPPLLMRKLSILLKESRPAKPANPAKDFRQAG